MSIQTDFTYGLFSETPGSEDQLDYQLDYEKRRIVDFAIMLGRPLLVEGEAGCGKTQLAYAIARQLLNAQPVLATVRSTSRANDLLYRFDAVRRLQDSQLKDPVRAENASFAYPYVSLQPLGNAIFDPAPSVVLIDEVDKADPDFANDLLHVLDQFEFQIDEIPISESARSLSHHKHDRTVPGNGARPIIVFTSNRERPLPKPFLRRCIYLELTFPEDPEKLVKIVRNNLKKAPLASGGRQGLEHISETVIESTVRSFLKVRKQAEKNKAYKLPATAELIDWVHVLHWDGASPAQIESAKPPHWEILFSTARDIHEHARTADQSSD
ncbi:AAA family ATPase [Roseobacter sp. EG26]|uniref:AAA family ATPase n=1 Tax=Roseobacter sp. EG26 TaxID=3412477 RepID=UPI003CE53FA1